MTKEYQVTLICKDGRFRPLSCLIKAEAFNLADILTKKSIIKRGVQKICTSKLWDKTDLVRYGYTKVKIREYNKEKIALENEARYTAIKEAHYADGSWKRPKSQNQN